MAQSTEDLTAKERSKLESEKTAPTMEEAVTPPVASEIPVNLDETTSSDDAIITQDSTPVPTEDLHTTSMSVELSEPNSVTTAAVSSPSEVEKAAPRVPLPVAIVDAVTGICLPSIRGEALVSEALPADATEGMGDTISTRLITRPQNGAIWTTHTLEGELLIGEVDSRPGACQVLAVTPIGDLVMKKTTTALMGLDSGFEIVDETGADHGTPIHWQRLRSMDGEFIDVLHYKGVPGGRASTLHVIVG
ncbi:MAG: hypothetical protein MRY64_12400 [Hyphomonadaceae bacterium]|nr:hypothetical protein [Hyphomonadaceae bacterium]